MNPKGRLIIIRGHDTDPTGDTEYELTSYQLLTKAFRLLSERKSIRIEIITTSNLIASSKEQYAAVLEKEGYSNTGFIHLRKKQDLDHYYSRILEAQFVVLADHTAQICEVLKGSAMLELLNRKYLHEEDFTIAGINAGAMGLPGLVLNDTEATDSGLGFISNCIIDTKFMHGERCKILIKAVICHQECLGLGLNSGMALIIEKGYKASCLGNSSVMVVNARDVKNKRLGRGASVYKKNLKGHILTEGSVLNVCTGDLIKNHLLPYNLNFVNRNMIQ
ncbi:hypothetical protein [Chryseobacterium sp. NFX27]|jgi:cyanophycinase|uniref:hypothetical protein n=1 Tax=Chryseobacterium sp. NFX27 TaxID=2819618 RepID=UPI003CF06F2B